MASKPEFDRLRQGFKDYRPRIMDPARVDKAQRSSDIAAMEAKLATLETKVGSLKESVDKLTDLPVELADLRGDVKVLATRVDALPTKEYMSDQFGKYLTRTGLIVTAIVGILGVVLKLIPIGN